MFVAVEVRLYRDSLAATLVQRPGLDVVGCAGSADEAIDALRHNATDLLVVDVALPEADRLMRVARAERLAPRVFAFGLDLDIAAVLAAAEAGASGFAGTNATVDELVSAVERTVAGELLCTPRMAAELLRYAAARAGSSSSAPAPSNGGLTSREVQVLSFVSDGLSNKAIASRLNIAEATVKHHVHHLLEKLQVRSRTQAAASVRPSSRPSESRSRQPALRRTS